MEIIVKIGDSKYPDSPVYLKNWMNGQPIEARWDGFKWGRMDRRHFAIIRTTDDFWQVRGGTDWKVWNEQAEEFKKYFSATDSQRKYRWEFGFLEDEKRLLMRDWFLDYDDLILQGLITQGEYDIWKDHDKESPIININRSFVDIIKNEYESRVLPTELKNQGITSGTYQIGTGVGADYATWALFATAVNAGNQMTGNLTGEGQNEETAISTVVTFDTDTNTHLLKITAESGAEHNGGAYGNGARINYATGDRIVFDETSDGDLDDVEISKLALDASGIANNGVQFVDGADSGSWLCNRVLIKGDASSQRGINHGAYVKALTIRNNIIYDFGNGSTDGGIYFNNVPGGSSLSIYNNTVIGCYDNIVQDYPNVPAGTLIVKNNLCQADSGGSDYRNDGGGWGTHSKNVSEDASGPDAAYDNTDVHTNSVFQNYAADDFRLDSAGDAVNLAILDDGDDLSGTFTDDIEGQVRATWYIGASEIVAAGGNAPTGGLYGSLVGPMGGPIGHHSDEEQGVQDMGDYNTTETVNLPFNTFTSDDPAASCTVTDLVPADIEIHKDGAIAQRTSDNGVTVSINFDGIIGNHMVHIDLSDNSDAGFYAVGSRFSVRLQGITVDGGSLNVWIGLFSIGCVLRPTTAGRTLDIQSTGEVDANLTMMGGVAQSAIDLKDFADDGYDPTLHDVETVKVNTDMVGTDNAALASVLGALNDVAAGGDPTDADTLVQYIKQLINVLIGTTGIAAFPAEAAPANAVSLAEVIRAIHVDVTGLNGDVMRGTDGANTTVPDAAGVAPTAVEIQTEMEANGASILDTLQDRITALLPTKTEMDTAHGLLATEAKQDIIDTNVDQIETAVITNAAGADVAADIIALKAETVNILTDTAVIGALGVGLTAIPWNSAWDAEVQSECNDALVNIGLDHLGPAVFHKMIITESNGNTELFNIADGSLGSIAAAFSTDGTFTTRKRLVI